MRIALLIAGLSSALTCAGPARADHPAVPVGSQFRVNGITSGYQYYPEVDLDAAGNFVVVWEGSAQDGSGLGISGRRFASDGTARGADFQVNSYTTGDQDYAGVAVADDGAFVVLWTDRAGNDGGDDGVFGQRYDGDGLDLGGEFQVNDHTTGNQENAAIGSLPGGGFVAAWTSDDGEDGSRFGVFGRRFDAEGAKLGVEFPVNTYGTGDQLAPSLAVDSSGAFVVTWLGRGNGDSLGIFARRFGSDGGALDDEFLVNDYTTDDQTEPVVGMAPGGDFVVAWTDRRGRDGDGAGVFARRFDSSGDALGPDFQVNTYTTSFQDEPTIAMEDDGDFVVAWTEGGFLDGDNDGIFLQRYRADGSARGDEFQVNTVGTGNQYAASIAMNAVGDFVVAWSDGGRPGTEDYDIVALRFSAERIFGDDFESGAPCNWSVETQGLCTR